MIFWVSVTSVMFDIGTFKRQMRAVWNYGSLGSSEILVIHHRLISVTKLKLVRNAQCINIDFCAKVQLYIYNRLFWFCCILLMVYCYVLFLKIRWLLVTNKIKNYYYLLIFISCTVSVTTG